jgi:hypothetical protein
MSCDVAAAGMIWLASLSGAHHGSGSAQLSLLHVLSVASAPPAVNALAKEPLYADIVGKAKSLKAMVESYRKSGVAITRFDAFKAQVDALSALDMKGHLDLAARGTDGDLKCILKGISQDLPRKLAELSAAANAKDRATALDDMFYLLRDNVEVITTPAVVTSNS